MLWKIGHSLSLSLMVRNRFIFDIRLDLFSISVYHLFSYWPSSLIRSMNIFKRVNTREGYSLSLFLKIKREHYWDILREEKLLDLFSENENN